MSRSEKRRAEVAIAFRVTTRELKDIEVEANRFGLSAGQYAKAAVLTKTNLSLPVLRRGPPRDAVALRTLVSQIGKIGANINQLARAANTPGIDVDKTLLESALHELSGIRKAVAIVLRVREP